MRPPHKYARLAERVEAAISALSADQTPVITIESTFSGERDLNGLKVVAAMTPSQS